MDRTASSSYHRRSNGSSPALASQPSRSSLSSPILNGSSSSQKGRESPNGAGFGSNGAASPLSNGDAAGAEEAAPKEERLIVGVDFGTTYSG
jgi:hypothetical protein